MSIAFCPEVIEDIFHRLHVAVEKAQLVRFILPGMDAKGVTERSPVTQAWQGPYGLNATSRRPLTPKHKPCRAGDDGKQPHSR